MTGTFTLFSLTPFFCATNVLARTTSNVVTPNTVLGSYAFYFILASRTSAAIGTVEFTRLLMIFISASEQWSATPSIRLLTMPVLLLNKSSLVIPGLRGTPTGINTKSTPFNAYTPVPLASAPASAASAALLPSSTPAFSCPPEPVDASVAPPAISFRSSVTTGFVAVGP
jgi:hypothetical protein